MTKVDSQAAAQPKSRKVKKSAVAAPAAGGGDEAASLTAASISGGGVVDATAPGPGARDALPRRPALIPLPRYGEMEKRYNPRLRGDD
jgi:hypothetical protein